MSNFPLLRRRGHRPSLIACSVGIALTTALPGCGVGDNAETSREVPDTTGVDAIQGPIALSDIHITGVPAVAGADLTLRGVITNNVGSDDRLLSISTPAATTVQLLGADGQMSADGLPIPGNDEINGLEGDPRFVLQDLTGELRPEENVPVRFVFSSAGTVDLQVPTNR